MESQFKVRQVLIIGLRLTKSTIQKTDMYGKHTWKMELTRFVPTLE